MFDSTNRSSGFGQMPAFGGFGSTPTQTNPFGSATQPSQPVFGSSISGSSTPFGASSQPTFGLTGVPSFGATSTPEFGATNTPAFGATNTSAFGATSAPAFGATSTPAFGSTSTPAFGSTWSAFGASNAPFGGGGAFRGSNNPMFGSTSTFAFGTSSSPFGASSSSAFGASSTPAFSFGSTQDFGQSSYVFGSSSPFGSITSTFGGAFGLQTTVLPFGNTDFEEEIRGQRGRISVVSYPAITKEDGSTFGKTAKLESISAMPAYKYKYKRFESCVAIAGADYCVIAADYTGNHTKISQLTAKCVMVSSGLQADVKALKEVLSKLIYKHKLMSCHQIDNLLFEVVGVCKYPGLPLTVLGGIVLGSIGSEDRLLLEGIFCKYPGIPYTVLGGIDSKGKGCIFDHIDGYAANERVGYNSQEEEELVMPRIPPILEYQTPNNDVIARLSETEAVDLAKTIFASTTCTGDKLEIVVLNANGLHREYMDLRKKTDAFTWFQ